MSYKFSTPQHYTTTLSNEYESSNRRYNILNQSNNHPTLNYLNNLGNNTIDYKCKTFELMKQLTQRQIEQKQNKRTINYLQRQLQNIHHDINTFLQSFNVRTLKQMKEKILLMMKLQGKKQQNYHHENNQLKEEKIQQEYARILKEYKQIIKSQQDKMSKYQLKWKEKENKLNSELENYKKKYINNQVDIKNLLERLQKKQKECQFKQNQLLVKQNEYLTKSNEFLLKQKQYSLSEKKYKQLDEKYLAQISTLKRQNQVQRQKLITLQSIQSNSNIDNKLQKSKQTQIQRDLQMLKMEFREILVEKQSIEEKYEKLKKKYKQEIDHFQMIQKEVEEKLIQVEKEIAYYKEQRQSNLRQIKQLNDEIKKLKDVISEMQHFQDKQEFSFAGDNEVATQTQFTETVQTNLSVSKNHIQTKEDEQQTIPLMNVECYEASIKSLLQENSRLKNALLLLNRKKEGQELPPEAELELKLLKGIDSHGMFRSQNKKCRKQSQDEDENKKQKKLQNSKKLSLSLDMGHENHMDYAENEQLNSPTFNLQEKTINQSLISKSKQQGQNQTQTQQYINKQCHDQKQQQQ